MATITWAVTLGGQTFELELQPADRPGEFLLGVVGKEGGDSGRSTVSLCHVHGEKYMITIGRRSAPVFIRANSGSYRTVLYGHDFTARVEEARLFHLKQDMAARESSDGPVEVAAPMPGLVLAVEVSEGAAVAEGDGLIVVESMKMENEIRSPVSGVVEEITVAEGETVDRSAVLARIVPEQDL